MVRSMTGFGRAELRGDTLVVTVEARSVNHRHLDVALRLPRALASLELDARKAVAARLERGRVDVSVQLTTVAGQAPQRVVTDAALAREYVAQARALAAALGDLGARAALPLEWGRRRPGGERQEETGKARGLMQWGMLERWEERKGEGRDERGGG